MPDARPVEEVPAGTRLGRRYELGKPIASGAMGAVYLGRDHETGGQVAVKRLREQRHAERFEIEARLLAQLRHPRVVSVLDHFLDETGNYLVMDLVPGRDLGRLLKERGEPGLPVADVIAYGLQACEALQYVHDQQIIHRDVKPQNMILSDDGVVLVDFGIAREFTVEETGTAGIGTPRYMAPEVLAGGPLLPRVDVYGLAATLWTLISGHSPAYPLRALAEVGVDVDSELEKTLSAGLELVPEHRIASIKGFAEALGAPLAAPAGVSLARSVPRPAAPRGLIEAVVRAAAGVFEAAAASVALRDRTSGELVYEAAWGAGADEIVGRRLPAGVGIAGSVAASGHGIAVPSCRQDPRFAAEVAAGTGYVPHTMLVVPLKGKGDEVTGVLTVLDRRDGNPYRLGDLPRADLFADLALATLEAKKEQDTRLG